MQIFDFYAATCSMLNLRELKKLFENIWDPYPIGLDNIYDGVFFQQRHYRTFFFENFKGGGSSPPGNFLMEQP